MKVRAVGTSEWLDLKGFKSTEFVQKLKISKTDAAKLMGKKIEFKIVANDGSESDTDFILESSSDLIMIILQYLRIMQKRDIRLS